MATSSIFNTPKFDKPESVERLAKALDEAEKYKRCEDCAYLVEGDNGEWICDDWSKNIHDVSNDDCALYKEWDW